MKGLSHLTEKEEIITLVDEDGEQYDFVVLDYFQVDDLNYAILFPLEKDEQWDAQDDAEATEMDEAAEHDAEEAVIFRVDEGDNGETMLQVIEDEEEWEKVAGIAYERLLSTESKEE